MKQICLIVNGGVNCNNVPQFVSLLNNHNDVEIDIILSRNAQTLFYADSFDWFGVKNIFTSHITIRPYHTKKYDIYIVAPATYNLIGKMANGIADDAGTTVLSYAIGRLINKETNIFLAIELHEKMRHQIFEQNLNILKEIGVSVIEGPFENDNYNLISMDKLYSELLAYL